MNDFSFTFIIGYRHQSDRLFNLMRTIEWVNAFSGSQVILVEQDKHSKISHLNLKCQHIFIKSEIPYNRSWSFNVGLKYAKSNVIVFGDSDLIMEPNSFIKSLQSIEDYEMISPYNSVIDLTQEESSMGFMEIINIKRPGRGSNDNQKINICGGISIFRKDAIERIGGWSEDFVGWGGEDDFQAMKVQKFLSYKELEGSCYHLYHTKSSVDQNLYRRTLELLNKASKMSDNQILLSIENSKKKNGMLNKYADYR